MPSYFELLPNDVLRHNLFPYLDYGSRRDLNLTFQPGSKIVTKIDSEKLVQVEMMLAIDPIKRALKEADHMSYKPATEKASVILNLINNILPKHLVIAQYNESFRQVLKERLIFFSDPTNRDFNYVSETIKNQIIEASSKTGTLLQESRPYIKELHSLKVCSWDPINAGNTIVAESCGNDISVSDGRYLQSVIVRKNVVEPGKRRRYRNRKIRRKSDDYQDYD